MITKMELLNKRLKEVVEKFNALKKSGMDLDILVTYISAKTKLTKKEVQDVLDNVDKFYNKILGDEVLKSLEE